jgi:very-short-patch-repair endonuclease
MNGSADQTALVSREAEKKSRHLPLRKLLAEAPDVLTAICPCWMTSPLSVSQLLGAERRYFDVVIFDEASQVLPEDAVCAFLRASQAVVAGDQRQLPPTTFFVAGEDEDDEADEDNATAGFESVLDVIASFLTPWSLDWHYRSRDEALIAFSNHHIYGGRLITFPGPGGPPVLSHVLVPHIPGRDGDDESASPEVQRMVELVLEHAKKRPHETLGVIAMGITHARRVEAAIDYARLSRPDLDTFFDEARTERFFVKNLERVQGDERDAIILTIGYGKDRSGRLLYRFGPLNQNGGERRLNVAVTRARRRMTLVSSFDHNDMDPSRIRSGGGVDLLRLYLQYAATSGARLGDVGSTGVPLNAFEADVFDALSAKGLPLSPQWGASRYRIDLVARHPQRPGRFVLAIECDGASYHSAPTARDRDRLRQQNLEALGWRFHRIWSTDWFMRREEEIERAVAAFNAALKHADREDNEEAGRDGAANTTRRAEPVSSGTENQNGPCQRASRPDIPPRSSISEYTSRELLMLVHWIQSDGRLRTDDEIVEEMVLQLGFRRRGARIDSAIRAAIADARSAG